MRIALEMAGHNPQGAFGQPILDHRGQIGKRTDISFEYLLAA
jgi:hypothetical protein